MKSAHGRMPNENQPGWLLRASNGQSGENGVNDVAVHVGQPAVDAVVAEGQLLVVDAQQVQDRGVQVVAVGLVLGGLDRRTRRSRRELTPPLMPAPASQVTNVPPL